MEVIDDEPDHTAGMTHPQIAAVLGVSVERVRQIEQNALRKLRCALRKKGLALDDFIIERPARHPLMRTCK